MCFAGGIMVFVTLAALGLLVSALMSKSDDDHSTPTPSWGPLPTNITKTAVTATTKPQSEASVKTTKATPQTETSETTTRTTTTTTPPKKAKPLDSWPLLCTYGLETNHSTTLPDDGLCDLIFFDSLYKNGRNKLSEPSRFDGNLLRIMGAAPRYWQTGFGVAFAYEHRSSLSTDLKKTNPTPLDIFWASNISHFGIVDMPAAVDEFSHIRDVFFALQELSKVVGGKSGFGKTPYIVLGAVPVSHGDFFGTRMRDIYAPTLFISQGHYAFGDNQVADCVVVPPTLLSKPDTSTSYIYDLTMAAKALKSAQAAGGRAKWLISVGMKGRWSHPNYKSQLRIGEKCEHNAHAKSFGRYTELCDVKAKNAHLKFGIAAYDLEYEDYENGCSDINKFGAFSRLKMIRKLVDYFKNVTDDVTDCVDSLPCS